MRLSIEGSAFFELPPKLAALLDLLLDTGSDADGLGSWLPRDEAGRRLGLKGSARRVQGTVSQWVYRLRLALWTHGINPFFVQTRRGRGVRIALRRMP